MPWGGVVLAVGLGASSPAPEASTPTSTAPTARRVSIQGSAGVGVIHRHPAEITDPYAIAYPGIVPAAALGVRVTGMPTNVITVSGEAELHLALWSRLEVGTPVPQRPRARTLGATVVTGVTWWPRAAGHRFGLGGELGYAVAPMLIAADSPLDSYMLHGPIARVRLEGYVLRERLQLIGRPVVGVALPYRLEPAAITRAGPLLGLMIRAATNFPGPVNPFIDLQIWNGHMRRGGAAPFDDHEFTGIAGIVVRPPRPEWAPRRRRRGQRGASSTREHRGGSPGA